MQREIAVKVEGLEKKYNLFNSNSDRLREILSISGKKYHNIFYALNDINFEVYKGETFGIIGTNGSGKSTLLKLITGVANPTSGVVEVNGKISALLELGAGFNKNYTGIENIYLNGTMMGYTKKQMDEKIKKIVEFADIGDFVYQPVKNYSSGMFARLAFAVAINIEPEILIVDEALSVGDVFFQNKCYKKFEELRKQGCTVIFVSHDIGTVKQLCSRVLWIEKGKQMLVGDSKLVCNEYSNNILQKKASDYKKKRSDNEKNMISHGEIEKKELELLPEISYTNESILSDKVEIISAFITDKNGKRVSECLAGEKYSLFIYFESKERISDCIAGFVIETRKGLWVTNCNSLSIKGGKPFEVRPNSINKVEFSFIMPDIVNGDYVIGVAISEGNILDFKVLTWLYNVLYMQITNVPENDGIIQIDADFSYYVGEK